VYKFGRPNIFFPAIVFRPKDCSAEKCFGRTIVRPKEFLYNCHTSRREVSKLLWLCGSVLGALCSNFAEGRGSNFAEVEVLCVAISPRVVGSNFAEVVVAISPSSREQFRAVTEVAVVGAVSSGRGRGSSFERAVSRYFTLAFVCWRLKFMLFYINCVCSFVCMLRYMYAVLYNNFIYLCVICVIFVRYMCYICVIYVLYMCYICVIYVVYSFICVI
jgi:hypothetical protein